MKPQILSLAGETRSPQRPRFRKRGSRGRHRGFRRGFSCGHGLGRSLFDLVGLLGGFAGVVPAKSGCGTVNSLKERIRDRGLREAIPL